MTPVIILAAALVAPLANATPEAPSRAQFIYAHTFFDFCADKGFIADMDAGAEQTMMQIFARDKFGQAPPTDNEARVMMQLINDKSDAERAAGGGDDTLLMKCFSKRDEIIIQNYNTLNH